MVNPREPRSRPQREQTRSFPRNRTRAQWVERERQAPTWNDDLKCYEFEYEEYEDMAERIRVGGRPFLIVNHKAQLRETHQRVVSGPNGGLIHVDAGEVLSDDMEAFVESDPLYYLPNGDGTWTRRDGSVTLNGFMFPKAPWAGGEDEALDPQWQRETFTIPIAEQVTDCKRRRLDRAEQKQEFGDKRGTTLNLQVGAGADDAFQNSATTMFVTASAANSDSTAEHHGFRFQGVTIAGGSTINDAILTVTINSATEDEPQHQVRGHDTDNAGEFTATNDDINSRTRTTAVVQWNSTGIGSAAGEFQQWGCTTDGGAGATIESVIQEITDRGGWSSGNAIVLIAEQHTLDGGRDLGIQYYETGSAVAAKLDIDYTAGGGGEDYLEEINEAVQIAEEIIRRRARVRRISETVEISETLRPVRTLLRRIAETVQIGEQVLRRSSLKRLLAETVQISEATVQRRSLVRRLSETVEIGETTVRTVLTVLIKLISETVEISEQIRRRLSLKRLLSETVEIPEQRRKVLALVRRISETVEISEVFAVRKALLRIINETIEIAETSVRSLLTVLTRIVNEVVEISEAPRAVRSLVRRLAETVQIGEQARATRALVRRLAETVEIGEAARKTAALVRRLSETVEISETRRKFNAILRRVNETVEVSEAISQTRSLVRRIAETVEVSESLRSVRSMLRIISETVQIGEGVIRRGVERLILRVIDETVQIAETRVPALWPLLRRAMATVQRQRTAAAVKGRGFLARVARQFTGVDKR